MYGYFSLLFTNVLNEIIKVQNASNQWLHLKIAIHLHFHMPHRLLPIKNIKKEKKKYQRSWKEEWNLYTRSF